MNINRLLTGLMWTFVISVVFLLPGSQHVQAAYPEKPISFIVPFGAGGGVDGMARALGARLEKALNVPVVVKNERGSGGRKGSIALYKSKPDGYTIGFAHFATLLYDATLGQKKSPIDYKNFEVILKADRTVFFIYVNAKTPFKTLADFKNAGRPIKFGSSGVGSPSWLVPEATRAEVGFPITFVAGYKNLAAVALAVARGDVDAATGTYTHIQGVLPDLRPLVYMADQKSYKLPEVPTIQDAGYPKLAALDVPWVVVAPPGTPEAQLGVLRKALLKIVNSEEFMNWAKEAGYNPDPMKPDAFWKSLQLKRDIYEALKAQLPAK